MKHTGFSIAAFIALTGMISCSDYDYYGDDEPGAVALEITGVNDSSVTLRWTQSDAEDFRNYKVYYSTRDVVDTTQKLSDSLSFRQDTTKTVRDLDPEKHYYFRVIVTTRRGLIAPSNTVDTTTQPNMRGKIVLLRPDSATDSSVNLRWYALSAKNLRRYEIYTDTNALVDTSDTLIKTVHDDTVAAIKGLRSGIRHWFRIYAYSDTGIIAASNIVDATTRSGIPEPVRVRVLTVTDTSAMVRWSSSPETDFSRYVIYYDTVPNVDSVLHFDQTRGDTQFVLNKLDTIAQIGGLQRGARYWISVYVFDKGGLFRASNRDSFLTDSGVPHAAKLSLVAATDSTVSLQWSKNADPDFLCYKVFFDTSSQVDTSDSMVYISPSRNTTALTVHNLKPEKQYWFRIAVVDSSRLVALSATVVNFSIILRSSHHDSTSVALSWSPSKDSAFAVYKLFRDTLSAVSDWSQSITPSGIRDRFTTGFIDTTAANAPGYYYRLYEYDNSGDGSGSNVVQGK